MNEMKKQKSPDVPTFLCDATYNCWTTSICRHRRHGGSMPPDWEVFYVIHCVWALLTGATVAGFEGV